MARGENFWGKKKEENSGSALVDNDSLQGTRVFGLRGV